MPRRPRIYIPGVAHHVIQRGNNRQACFGDESDYKAYLTDLKESALQNGVAIHAYVLMTDHASEYPWSSYRNNAVGLNIGLITPHREYKKLGRDSETRRKAYRKLFRGRMSEKDLHEIRDCTNKAWVLGDDRFKVRVEAKTGIPSQPVGRGGDRKSAEYRALKNQ